MKLIILLLVTLYCVASAPPGGWSNVTMEEVNNTENIQKGLQMGIDFILQTGIKAGRIPNNTYATVEIVSVRKQVVNGINYDFHVKLSDGEGATVDATFVIWCKNGNLKITSWRYSYKLIDDECHDADPNDIDYADDDAQESTEEEAALFIPEEYYVIGLDEFEDSEEIQKSLNFGANYMIQQGVKDGHIPNNVYQITDVYRAWKKASVGDRYKFHIALKDTSGDIVKTIFNIHSQGDYNLVTCYKYTYYVPKKKTTPVKEEEQEEEEAEVEPDSAEEECEEEAAALAAGTGR